MGCPDVALTHAGQVYKEVVNFNHLCKRFEDAVRRKDHAALGAIREEARVPDSVFSPCSHRVLTSDSAMTSLGE